MDMEGALRARALEDEDLAALIDERASWELRPQGEGYPAITFQVISNPRDQHMKGFQTLERTRVQADVWALNYADKKAVTEALIAALVPAGVFHGVRFNRALIASDADRPAGGSTEDGQPPIFRRSVDFIIWHRQA